MGLFGCLQEWDDVVDLYLDEVLLTVDATALQDKFRQVLDALNWTRPPSHEDAELLLQQNPPRVLSRALKGLDNTPVEYSTIFSKLFDN